LRAPAFLDGAGQANIRQGLLDPIAQEVLKSAFSLASSLGT
jgi:hypothetical protein